jgi:tetratricopeptide (TPR) repeat protein
MSQRDLAEPGLSASYVSLIESGRRQPTLDVLEQLAVRLQTTSAALLTGIEPEPSRGVEQIELDLRWAKIALRAGSAESAEKYARAVLDDPARTESHRLDALVVLAGAAESLGRLDDAIDILEPLVAELDASQTRELWQQCQVMLCRCYKHSGDLAHAIDLGERVLASRAPMSDEQVMLVISLADAYQLRGDTKRAGRLLEKTMGREEVAGSQRNRGATLWNSSIVAYDEGRLSDAIKLSERALGLFGESDAVRNLGRLRLTYGTFLREEGRGSIPIAREQLNRALEDFKDEGTVMERANCLTELARCALDEDDVLEADRLSAQAADVVKDGPDGERAYVDLVRGHVMVRLGDIEAGLLMAQKAARVLDEEADCLADAARAWREVAELARSVGRRQLVEGALERAVDALGVRPTRVGTPRVTPIEQRKPIEEAGPIERSAPIEAAGPIERSAPIEAAGPIERPGPIEFFAPIER